MATATAPKPRQSVFCDCCGQPLEKTLSTSYVKRIRNNWDNYKWGNPQIGYAESLYAMHGAANEIWEVEGFEDYDDYTSHYLFPDGFLVPMETCSTCEKLEGAYNRARDDNYDDDNYNYDYDYDY